MKKPSPLNARTLRLMERTGCSIFMSDRVYGNPIIGRYSRHEPSEARTIGAGINIKKRNVETMHKDGLIQIINRPHRQYEDDEYKITDLGIMIVGELRSADFEPKKAIKPYFSDSEIKAILKGWHDEDGGWIFLTEFAIEGRRIDAYALGLWMATRYLSIGYEIKVNRGDLLLELKDPDKRAVAMRHCHQFYFVTTKGLAHHTEFPEDCGLIEIWENKSRHVVIDAPVRDIGNPSWLLAGRIAHRANQEYHQRYDWETGWVVGECSPMPELEPEEGLSDAQENPLS
jgi:hypothetical protein